MSFSMSESVSHDFSGFDHHVFNCLMFFEDSFEFFKSFCVFFSSVGKGFFSVCKFSFSVCFFLDSGVELWLIDFNESVIFGDISFISVNICFKSTIVSSALIFNIFVRF